MAHLEEPKLQSPRKPIAIMPTVAEIATAAKAEAQPQYDGMKHSSRLTPKGATAKLDKLIRASAERRAAEITTRVLEDYRWSYDDIQTQSAIDFSTVAIWRHPKHLLSLFQPDDVLWCGETHETREGNFKTRDEWIAHTGGFAPFTCPSTFHPGVFSRAQINAVATRFLVVESDTLNRNTVGAIFRWLVEVNSMKLRAIVDTGGKSLHAWLEHPGDETAADLKLVLPTLGCDRRMFVPTQPCRMPGVGRNGRFQKLIYLK